MATSKTTIELNGKLYDARTGKIVGEGAGAGSTPAIKHVQRSHGAVLDGFLRRPAAAAARQPTAHAQAVKPKPAVARTAPHHAVTKLEKSKTLMRPAVKKPVAVNAHTAVLSQKHAATKKEDPARSARAAAVPRSNQIQRFNPRPNEHRIIKKEAALAVARPADHNLANRVSHLAASTETQVKHSVDIIEESLRSASSHLQTFEDRAVHGSFWHRIGFKNKTANLASLSFAGLLLVGFFALQNGPRIEMQVAATRSGVSASLPGYSPAGFSASNGIKSEPGKVTVAYKSNTNDKQFSVTQQASNWSSDSLLSNHVLASKATFQTYQDEGKTVYIYDNSNATWVNGGIWYRIDGNASLTSDQLLRIANSF